MTHHPYRALEFLIETYNLKVLGSRNKLIALLFQNMGIAAEGVQQLCVWRFPGKSGDLSEDISQALFVTPTVGCAQEKDANGGRVNLLPVLVALVLRLNDGTFDDQTTQTMPDPEDGPVLNTRSSRCQHEQTTIIRWAPTYRFIHPNIGNVL